MIADAIRDVSGRGDIVLDVFGGSGSTLISAEKTARRAYLCEFGEIYCDRIIARRETYAKDESELVSATGQAKVVRRSPPQIAAAMQRAKPPLARRAADPATQMSQFRACPVVRPWPANRRYLRK